MTAEWLRRRRQLVLLALLSSLVVPVARTEGYRRAPDAIRAVLDAPARPVVSIDPTRRFLLVLHGIRYPGIAELAEPMLGLAGLRINPRTNGPHRSDYYVAAEIRSIADGAVRPLALPPHARISWPRWSPDGNRLAFTNTTADRVELWMADTQTGRLRQVPGLAVNAVFGDPIDWMPDSRSVLCRAIPAERSRRPMRPNIPLGPTEQETSGRAGPVRTYQDLLDDSHEEAEFDYFATSQLALIRADASVVPLGPPAVYVACAVSPDGRHLLVSRLKRPCSYLHPASMFPREVHVWGLSGESEYALADLPLEDQVPIEGVPTGPRAYHWRPDEPATLVWTEALDGGDPRRSVPHRDRIRLLREPFREEPTEVARTEHRFTSLVWSAQDGRALLREYDRERRWARTFWISADRPGETGVLLWDRSVQDRYSDPGTPLLRTLANGHRVLWQHGSAIFLEGEGASDEGDRPFLDRFDLETRQTERLFHCDRESYEQVIGLLRDDGREFITRWENPQEPPNYRIRQAGETAARSLTDFPDPTPQLRGIQKKLITYARADGVPLSFTLYLPPNHPPSHPLPTLVWAYPREYNEARTAGQVSGSTRRYTTIGGISHLFFVLAGYAVLDGASMPVVGTPETMNDTYVTQIVDSARAAIDKAVELGVTDPERVGVGGHSYGAFMTANLLAHSDLFRAGIARSGAYNRTLTPFGFQSERRTLWEARETYFRVSPFLAADRIREPLLLIHGAADDNTGTFPLQSERMYQAIHGNGGMARLVMLPYEAHAYVARESIEHTLAEMIDWFDRHVKPARQASVAPESVGAPVADFAALERMIQDELRASRTPGAAVAVIQDDKLVFAKGFGMASVDTREPVRPEMLFRLGSTTKMFTAATMGLLAAEGKLKFDEPVGNHIAQLHPAIAALTPHQLLTHTAGLTDESKMSGRHDDAVLGEIVRQMDDRHWLFARPGDVYSYANPGYWIAGHVCEVIERKPYADVLDERLFRALGMTRSTVRPTAAMSWPLAIGHEVRRGKAEVVRPQADNAATRPAGQIYSNVFELTRFVRALMAQGRLDGQQVLPADVVAQLSSPHVPRPGTSDQYGYGLAIGRWQGETIWQHGGSRAGYGSHIAMLPERRTAVIVLTNRTGSSLPRSWKIALSLTGVSGSAPSDESSEPAPWNEGEQQQFVGTFSNLRQTLEWYQEEGQLRWRRTKQTEDGPRAGRVVKLGPDLMGMLVADDESQSPVRVPVVRDEAGRVAYICISGRALRRQSEESEASR